MLRHLRVTVEGHAYDVTVEDLTDTGNHLYPDHRSMTPTNATAPVTAPVAAPPDALGGSSPSTGPAAPAPTGANAGDDGATAVLAPMSGVVVEIGVSVGDTVSPGQIVAVFFHVRVDHTHHRDGDKRQDQHRGGGCKDRSAR